MSDRTPIFDAFRAFMGGRLTQAQVDAMDALLDGFEPKAPRTVGGEGIALIKRFEGLKLRAYPDPGSGGEPWTVGIGTTVYPDGRKVRPGDVVTEAQAEEYLRHDLARFETAVNKMTGGVTTQGQFDALVSWFYNIGTEAARHSTLLRKHNEGDYAGAAHEFERWVFAGGERLAGLVKRRAAERKLYEGAGE